MLSFVTVVLVMVLQENTDQDVLLDPNIATMAQQGPGLQPNKQDPCLMVFTVCLGDRHGINAQMSV